MGDEAGVAMAQGRRGALLRVAGRGWRRAAVTAGLVVAVFAAATARLFVFPAAGMPEHVDAVAVLDGVGRSARLAVAFRLAEQGRAPTLLISRGTRLSQSGPCPRPAVTVRVVCFNPSPATTQGEAEFIGRFARQHRWKSVALVTVAPQGTRARLRLSRCFAGQIYVVTAPLPAGLWPYEVAYEWGATLKAVLVQRGC